MKYFFLFVFSFVLVALQKEPLQASHLIVGEMSYKHLGNNNYQFTIYYYRDCRPPSQGGGNPSALQSDDPIFVSIYNGQSFFSFDSVYSQQSTTIPIQNPNNCETSASSSCMNRMLFTFVKHLPPSNDEYTIINQRCCMNESIANIDLPGTKGYTFFCKIPGQSLGLNNSAVLTPIQNVKYCVNKQYTIDHSATDADADSLSYGFDLPLLGGSAGDPKPLLIGGNIPPFITSNYSNPYSVSNPAPNISINEKTGLITLNPSVVGSFLLNIYCKEWRNGIHINTVNRTYVYTVNNCNFDVDAEIACDSNLYDASKGNLCISNCDTKTIQFKNNSKGAITYHWDFGVNGLLDDTSNAYEPSYTYTDTGIYKVVLTAIGANCSETSEQSIGIFNDEVSTDFTYSGNLCTGSSIQFTSNSSSATDSIYYWKWDFVHADEQVVSLLENPSMAFYKEGLYTTTLRTYNRHGCMAQQTKELNLSTVHVKAYQDATVVKGNTVNLTATGADNYYWYLYGTNASFISNNSANAIVQTINPDIVKVFVVGSNIDGCSGYDSVKIIITDNETVFVPTVFSPNGDQKNDILKIFLSGYSLKYFRIYNRRGQEVFHTNEAGYGWDGIYNGRELGLDTYYWVACVVNNENKTKIFKGDVVLMR